MSHQPCGDCHDKPNTDCPDCFDKMLRSREVRRMQLRGRLTRKPFGKEEEFFLNNAAVPFLAQLQKYIGSIGGKPVARVKVGEQIFEGAVDVEMQKGWHVLPGPGNKGRPMTVRRFRVGGDDLAAMFVQGVYIELELKAIYTPTP